MSSVYIERKDNNELSKRLTKENGEIFTSIVCYLRVSNINEKEQEEVISDILVMFLDWQEQGKDIDSMVGGDCKKFIEDIISAVNPKNSILEMIKQYLGVGLESFVVLLTINFAFSYLSMVIKEGFRVKFDYDLSMLISFIIIFITSCALLNYLGKSSIERLRKPNGKSSNFVIGGVIGVVIILLVFISKLFEDIVLISIDIRYVIGIMVAYWGYTAIRVLKNNYTYGKTLQDK